MRSVAMLQNKSIGTKNHHKPRVLRLSIAVLKTVDCNRSMSSNPIASAIFIRQSPDFSGLCRFWGLAKIRPHPKRYKTFRVPLQNYPVFPAFPHSANTPDHHPRNPAATLKTPRRIHDAKLRPAPFPAIQDQ